MREPKMTMDLLTVEEAAKLLRAHTNTVYKMCRQGRLPAAKIGKEWRIDRAKLEGFIEGPSESLPVPNQSPAKDFTPGHTLALMPQPEDVWDFEARFFMDRVRQGYLLFKACWWQNPEKVRQVLTRKGLPVAELESSGEMVIADLAGVFQESGPLAAADSWRSTAHRAMERGFHGLIGVGSPALEGCCSLKELLTFEEALDGFLDGLPVQGVCAYHLEEKNSTNWNALVRLMKLHGEVLFRSPDLDVKARIC